MSFLREATLSGFCQLSRQRRLPRAKEDEGHELIGQERKAHSYIFECPFMLEMLLTLDSGTKGKLTDLPSQEESSPSTHA